MIGDFILNNRIASIIGASLQALGAVISIIPFFNMFIIGMVIFILGNILYSPNLTSFYGKKYYKKKQHLDLAILLKYASVNIGSFFGVFCVGLIFSQYGYTFAAILAGLFFITSSLFIILSSQSDQEVVPKHKNKPKSILIIAITLLAGTIWYSLNLLTSEGLTVTNNHFLNLIFSKNHSITYYYGYVNLVITLIVILFTYFLWKKFAGNYLKKIIISSMFGSVGLFIWYYLIVLNSISLYFISLIMISIIEVQFETLITSIFIKYLNPKFLATFIGGSSLIYYLANIAIIESGKLTFLFGAIGYTLIGVTITFVFYYVKNKSTKSSDI